MAAKDPAFLFYPSDASEDTQFMNRLERGCYFDLLKAQKKFKRFTIDTIRKVLGKDFTSCWDAIEIVLKKDEIGYFIEWADDAITKRETFSKLQRERIKNFHLKKNYIEEKKEVTEPIPNLNKAYTEPIPVGNGIGIVNEIIIENVKGGAGGKSIWKEIVSTWFEYYEEKFNTTPTFEGKECKALKSIAEKLKNKAVKAQCEWNVSNARDTLRHFLIKAYSDRWLKEHFLLPTLLSQFDAIIQKDEATPNSTKYSTRPAVSATSAFSKIDAMHSETGK